MALEIDARGSEPRALSAASEFGTRKVLEIGAGDGRLTFRFGAAPRFVAGIDLKIETVARAIRSRPPHLRRRLSFLPASAMALPFRGGTFDIALLAWSL